MADEIVNKVAKSGLVTLDLETYYPEGERYLFDLKECLWQGLVLREKDFRDFIKNHDWSAYEGKMVAVYCSVDAIVPTWAYMLLAVHLEPFAQKVFFGDLSQMESLLFKEILEETIKGEDYQDARVVIKGCSKWPVPPSAYVELTAKLRPYARTIMYGEPCSTVPLYKRPKQQ